MSSNEALGIRLTWAGKSNSKPQPPGILAPLREASGQNPCRLITGDNALAMATLAAQSESFALVYMDPPFFTGREHHAVSRAGGARGRSRKLEPAFDDRWENLEHYLEQLQRRIQLAYTLLDARGCLVLHVDPKTSHYVKILCDEVFGSAAFASEIVWRYRRWPAKTPNFQRVHDVLLRYVRDPREKPRFNQLYEPLAASTLATWGTQKQRAVLDGTGNRCRSSVLPERTPGAPLGDVWEIGIVAPVAKERTGYPTQKPEALLERLLLACTTPGDRVLDPYLGSGTTLAVAQRLGRSATGIDESPTALFVAKKRLEQAGHALSEWRATQAPESGICDRVA